MTTAAVSIVDPRSLRPPRPEERDSIFALYKSAHEDNGIFPMSDAKVLNLIDRAIARDKVIMGLIDGPKGVGGLEAVATLELGQPWYSDSWILDDKLIYVHADCRKSTHIKRLLEFVKWCSDSMSEITGYPVPVFPGILTRKLLFEKMRLFQRTFPIQIGAIFAYNLPEVGATFNQRRAGDIKAA